MEDFDATLYATMRPARGGKSLVTLSTYQERQEALNRTSIMEDDTSHRTSRNFTNEKSSIIDNTDSQQQQTHQQSIPPPPPQFANSPEKSNHGNNIYGKYYQTIKTSNGTTSSTQATKQLNLNVSKPPSSPTPDYDNMEYRKGGQIQVNDATTNHNKNISSTTSTENVNTNRRTMRLGAVTIGEYEQQRKEPNKFEFVTNRNRDNTTSNNPTNGRNIENLQSELHDTLSRSKLRNGSQVEHQRDCPLRNGYSNGNGIDHLTRKIQGVSLTQKQIQNYESSSTIKRQGGSTTNGTNGSTGILKNGNSRTSASGSSGTNGHSAKLVEKTITFGN